MRSDACDDVRRKSATKESGSSRVSVELEWLLVVVERAARLRVVHLPKHLIREDVQSEQVLPNLIPLPGMFQLMPELRRYESKRDLVCALWPPDSDAVTAHAGWAVWPVPGRPLGEDQSASREGRGL
jgi:hypothetical protein